MANCRFLIPRYGLLSFNVSPVNKFVLLRTFCYVIEIQHSCVGRQEIHILKIPVLANSGMKLHPSKYAEEIQLGQQQFFTQSTVCKRVQIQIYMHIHQQMSLQTFFKNTHTICLLTNCSHRHSATIQKLNSYYFKNNKTQIGLVLPCKTLKCKIQYKLQPNQQWYET